MIGGRARMNRTGGKRRRLNSGLKTRPGIQKKRQSLFVNRIHNSTTMKPKELIQKKFRTGWSDLQFLVLLELAERGEMRFTELVDNIGYSTGVSNTGIWNALSNPTMENYIIKEKKQKWPVYRLSNEGMRAVAKSLTPVSGARAKPPREKSSPPSETVSFQKIPWFPFGAAVRGFLC